ncbi:glycoside hydrolase family 71 protein [Thelephora ganbajun]|uniref:Glycoside hydrolase family 71 protein n=1 Tax=Thelephora ganbajun TaxID=370292 RepID=A0ACB6Z9K5_THEGA|nr:glycoside hydrolase family 71 protein [Thelephora ganbajun]
MVGNTYPYVVQDWVDDIRLAHASGFDGFALNVGPEDWQVDRVHDCYNAAQSVDLPFKLFISFDMTCIPCASMDDIIHLLRYIQPFLNHGNQYYRDGKLVISTFAGQDSRFGHHTFEHGWAHIKRRLEEITPICFIPSFFIDPRRYPSLPFMDGYFNWNGSWPIHLNKDSPPSEIRLPSLDTDRHHLHHLGGRAFIAAVSPWFFTHYGADSWNKNWIYRGDDHLFIRRWEQLVEARDKVDMAEIISWNDYGESHYVGPIKGAQPNSQAWVDGFSHEPWLQLNSYFAFAFKNGYYPKIHHDKIFIWGRPHPKAANASDDCVPRPDNWELTDDKFWVVVLAAAPGTIWLSSGEHTKSWNVPAGLSKLSHPLESNGTMRASLYRGEDLVAHVDAAELGFHFNPSPRVYNFNVLVAMSS